MKWTAQQETALKKMADFIRDPNQLLFRLWGEAGTGKTTLAAEIRDRFDHLAFIALAYTGKAASRLRQKGWCNAGTIHSHLYIPGSKCRARITEMEARVAELEIWIQQTGDNALPPDVRAAHMQEQEELGAKIAAEEEALKSPMFILNTETDLVDYKVIVLDEVSMVGKEGYDLEKLCRENRIKLILMGDPYQLPPVKSQAHFMGCKPDYQLTDVQRQAKDDPILWLAHKARAGERIPLGSYGQSKVVRRMEVPGSDDFHPEQLAEMVECDQLLVGTNNTRTYCNEVMRAARGYKGKLEVGEKLVCLANSKQGFFNGSIWYCQDILEEDTDRDRVIVALSSDDPMEEDRIAKIHNKSLKGLEVHFTERSGAECMVSAQALTVHKFQGSEGRHIMILDESYTAREDAHRWLYTAITRAQERLTLVTKG